MLAALAGTYFLRKNPNTLVVNKYLVYLLWYTFLNEVIGMYAVIGYFSSYDYFGFIENTTLKDNVWLYNLYVIIDYSVLVYYFGYFLTSKKIKSIINYIIIYITISVSILFYTEVFFKTVSLFANIAGVLLLFYSITLFYFSLLKSNNILILKNYLPIYINRIIVFSFKCNSLGYFFRLF